MGAIHSFCRGFRALSTFTLVALSQSTWAVELEWAGNIVAESKLSLRAKLEPGENFNYLEVSASDRTSERRDPPTVWIFPFKNGIAQGSIYLRGAGKHFVSVSASITEYNSRGLRHETVENRDPRPHSEFLAISPAIDPEDPVIQHYTKKTMKELSTRLGDVEARDPWNVSRAIYHYITSNVAYDVKPWARGETKSYTAQETARDNLAMCTGYARLNVAMHRAAGIPAKLVFGLIQRIEKNSDGSVAAGVGVDASKPIGHAWSEIYLGGRWVVQDPTWDSGAVKKEPAQFIRNVQTRYFDPDPAFFSRTHVKPVVQPE